MSGIRWFEFEFTCAELLEEGVLDDAVDKGGAKDLLRAAEDAVSVAHEGVDAAGAKDCEGATKLRGGLGAKGLGGIVKAQ